MTDDLNSNLYHGEVSFESKPRVTLGCSSVGRVLLKVDGWMDELMVSFPFISLQPSIKSKISWHVLIWLWVSTPQTTPSLQSGHHLLKAWSRQSQAMSMIDLVESVGCKPPVGHAPVSFLSRTWHVLNGVDAKMLALPTVAGEGLIHSINGITLEVPCSLLGAFVWIATTQLLLNQIRLVLDEDSYRLQHITASHITSMLSFSEAHGSSTWGALPSSATFSDTFAQNTHSMHWLNLQQEKCILPGVSPLPASMGWGTTWMKHDEKSSIYSSLCSFRFPFGSKLHPIPKTWPRIQVHKKSTDFRLHSGLRRLWHDGKGLFCTWPNITSARSIEGVSNS